MRYGLLLIAMVLLAGCATHTPPTSRILAPADGANIVGPFNLTFVLGSPRTNAINFTILVDGKPAGSGLAINNTPRTIPLNLSLGVHAIQVEALPRGEHAVNSTPRTVNVTPVWRSCVNTVVPSSIIVYQPPSAALGNSKWDTGYDAYEQDGGISCHWGSATGENVNYLYCSNLAAERTVLSRNGTILSKQAVTIRLVGEYAARSRGAPTPSTTQMRVISATCHDIALPTTGSCTDTDGGIDYGVAGKVSTGAQDTCTTDGRLREYYCGTDGQVKALLYTCPTACQNGACVGMP